MSGRPGRGAGGRPRGAKTEGETVIAGVDTHKDVHVLCLLDGLGRKIWSGSFGADPEGYDRLAEAIGDPGSCAVVGVEGTASYGAGLTRRYVARRTSEGKSRREAVRCLKRYIAREVYRVLMDPNPDGAAPEGPELAKMRKAMRVTQKKAAAELGLSAATLGHLEHGRRRSTKLERRYYELLCELERALPQTAS